MGLDTTNEVIGLSVMNTEYTDPNMTLSWTKALDKSANGQARGMRGADETKNVQETGVHLHGAFHIWQYFTCTLKPNTSLRFQTL